MKSQSSISGDGSGMEGPGYPSLSPYLLGAYEEQRSWLPSDAQLRAAINKVLRAVNRRFDILEALPFELLTTEVPNLLQNLHVDDIYSLVDALDPVRQKFSKRADSLSAHIKTLIPEGEREKFTQMLDDFGRESCDSLHGGFLIGMFMGARMAGCSKERLKVMGEHLFRTIKAEPRFGRRQKQKRRVGSSKRRPRRGTD